MYPSEFQLLYKYAKEAISEASSKPISEEVKKAREKTDEWVNNTYWGNYSFKDQLKQLLAAERQAK